MAAPKFEFMANSDRPGDKSGVALWRYTVRRQGVDVDVVVRQSFNTFAAAKGIDDLVRAAWMDGEAEGFARCERGVLDALRGYK